MLLNQSEQEITQINQNVFFKEFTFDKNDFVIDNRNKVELADNVLWLDDLLIIIQIKEKDSEGCSSVEDWLKNKVFKKAKNQIKSTLRYLYEHKTISIANGHNDNHILDIQKMVSIHSVVIYKIDDWKKESEIAKKYITRDNCFIHFISFDDYIHICRYIITPVELGQYFVFREELLRRNTNIDKLPEQYFLAHYFQNPTNATFNILYICNLDKICEKIISREDEFYLGSFINHMRETLYEYGDERDYYFIIRELAKLNREEMKLFKERLLAVMNEGPKALPILMKRFASLRTQCGFVLMRLNKKVEETWSRALVNFPFEFKYKWKLNKCIGLVVLKDNDHFDFRWSYMEGEWEYDEELEKRVEEDIEVNGKGKMLESMIYRDLID